MILIEISAAFIIAFALTTLTFFLFRSRGPWGNRWFFLLVLFMAVWAANLWIRPVGPAVYEIHWIPMLFTGFLFALLLGLLAPLLEVRPPEIPEGIDFLEQQHLARQWEEEMRRKNALLLVLLWVLLGLFSMIILLGYLLRVINL